MSSSLVDAALSIIVRLAENVVVVALIGSNGVEQAAPTIAVVMASVAEYDDAANAV